MLTSKREAEIRRMNVYHQSYAVRDLLLELERLREPNDNLPLGCCAYVHTDESQTSKDGEAGHYVGKGSR